MIHGVGAETGSQALLLAGIAGVTGVTGIVILLAFVVGLLLSNTLVAVVSASGFIGAQRLRTVYVVVGFVAGLGSLLIGILFITGLGTALPDREAPRPVAGDRDRREGGRRATALGYDRRRRTRRPGRRLQPGDRRPRRSGPAHHGRSDAHLALTGPGQPGWPGSALIDTLSQ